MRVPASIYQDLDLLAEGDFESNHCDSQLFAAARLLARSIFEGLNDLGQCTRRADIDEIDSHLMRAKYVHIVYVKTPSCD